MPGCGASVPRRAPRTRTGRHAPRSRSEPTRGSRRPGARLGSGPGRRGSRRQRGCRRGDAAAGWGCERAAERCPPAPASASPPPCGPLREHPAARRGASEPGLGGCGPVRPAPAQREVSAPARSLPPIVPPSPPASVSPLSVVPKPAAVAGPCPRSERSGGGQRLPYLLAWAKGTSARPSHRAPPWGGSWTPSRGRGAREGSRVSHSLVPELCGLQAGSRDPGRWEGKGGRGAATAAQVGEQRGF